MKKILLPLLFIAFTSLANSQSLRIIDLEALSIESPDTVRDGQPVPFKFAFRNLGPDTINIGDSLFYQTGLKNNYYVSNFYLRSITAPVYPNDTIAFSLSGNGIHIDSIYEATACIFGILQNRGAIDPMMEDTGSLCRMVHFTYIYPVSVSEIDEAKAIHIYPNPANSSVTFDLTGNSKQIAEISITEITGKTVAHLQTAGESLTTFDISRLTPGLYLVHIRMGEMIKTQKLIISR
jgi:hypothetical protein